MKDTNQNLSENSSHEITTFPLGYYLENDLVPSTRENESRSKVFEQFERNWQQLTEDTHTLPVDLYSTTDSELDSESLQDEDYRGR